MLLWVDLQFLPAVLKDLCWLAARLENCLWELHAQLTVILLVLNLSLIELTLWFDLLSFWDILDGNVGSFVRILRAKYSSIGWNFRELTSGDGTSIDKVEFGWLRLIGYFTANVVDLIWSLHGRDALIGEIVRVYMEGHILHVDIADDALVFGLLLLVKLLFQSCICWHSIEGEMWRSWVDRSLWWETSFSRVLGPSVGETRIVRGVWNTTNTLVFVMVDMMGTPLQHVCLIEICHGLAIELLMVLMAEHLLVLISVGGEIDHTAPTARQELLSLWWSGILSTLWVIVGQDVLICGTWIDVMWTLLQGSPCWLRRSLGVLGVKYDTFLLLWVLCTKRVGMAVLGSAWIGIGLLHDSLFSVIHQAVLCYC